MVWIGGVGVCSESGSGFSFIEKDFLLLMVVFRVEILVGVGSLLYGLFLVSKRGFFVKNVCVGKNIVVV